MRFGGREVAVAVTARTRIVASDRRMGKGFMVTLQSNRLGDARSFGMLGNRVGLPDRDGLLEVIESLLAEVQAILQS